MTEQKNKAVSSGKQQHHQKALSSALNSQHGGFLFGVTKIKGVFSKYSKRILLMRWGFKCKITVTVGLRLDGSYATIARLHG